MSKATSPSSLGSLLFYCTISRKVTYSYTVPQYPIDTGRGTSSVYVVKSPAAVDLVVFESSTPVTYDSYMADTQDRENRLSDVKDALTEMYLSNELYTLTTPDDVYENMVITNLSFPNDDYANAMEISISLRQVNIAEEKFYTIDYEYAESSSVDTGTTETTSTEDASDSSSSWISDFLTDFKHWIINTFGNSDFSVSI